MALLQALLSWISRSSGRVLNAIFGWTVVGLFGRLSRREQTMMSGVVALAALWPVLLVGIIAPKTVAFLVTFIPVAKSIPDGVIRSIWLGLAVLAPVLVGSALAMKGRSSAVRESPLVGMVRGYPVTLALATSFLFMFVTVPVLRIISMLRGHSDEHIPLITEGREYEEATALIDRLLADHGFHAVRGVPPWWVRFPAVVLHKVGGRPFRRFMPERFAYWQGPAIQVALYPGDVLVRGAPTRAAWTHGLISERFARGPGIQTTDAVSQDLEHQIRRVWLVFEEQPEAHLGSPVLMSRVREITRALGRLEVPYDDWQIIYRKIAQLARAIQGEPQLLESVSTQGGSMDRVEPVGQEFRPREDDSTRDLIAQLLRQGTELVKKEVELARSEMNVQVKSMVAMSTGFGIAAVLAVVGIVLLCGAAVFGLANAMPLWAAALIVGIVVLAIAGIMMSVAKKKIVRNPFERTRRTLKETLQWARERMA